MKKRSELSEAELGDVQSTEKATAMKNQEDKPEETQDERVETVNLERVEGAVTRLTNPNNAADRGSIVDVGSSVSDPGTGIRKGG